MFRLFLLFLIVPVVEIYLLIKVGSLIGGLPTVAALLFISVLELSSLREAREEFEKEFIIQKLEEHDWNVSRTAEAIELERSNLHRKIKSYGIDMKK